MFHNRLLPLQFIKEQGLSVDPPSEDSFFFRAFNANIKVAEQSLNTKFIQGIKNGNLSPDNYGALTVLDAYYCYNGATSFQIALQNTDEKAEPQLAALLKKLTESYEAYNKTFLDVWHLLNADCVVPTETCKNYAHHERIVANYYAPIYTLVAMLPCYYLWYWLSDQIYSFRENNLYGYWIEGCHSSSSAYTIGNFIDEWMRAGKPFSEDAAMRFYADSMKYEFGNFDEACKAAAAMEGFYHGK